MFQNVFNFIFCCNVPLVNITVLATQVRGIYQLHCMVIYFGSGLDNFLPNSYINCIIQIIFHIAELRVILSNHFCDKVCFRTSYFNFLFSAIRMFAFLVNWVFYFAQCIQREVSPIFFSLSYLFNIKTKGGLKLAEPKNLLRVLKQVIT